jgi:hypothetical protein
MNRQRIAVAALAAIGSALAISAPASATTSGHETMNGVIVASGASGVRTVLSSVIVARGAFNGVGRIVEIDNLPGDPDDVSRDDLVFPAGSMHLVSVTHDVSLSLDARSCLFKVTLQQTGSVVGGTGRFSRATGTSTATVVARGLARRDADGECTLDQAPLAEVDTLTSNGTLSF